MGDRDGAKDILDEVLREGNADQQREAKGTSGSTRIIRLCFNEARKEGICPCF